MSNKENVKIAYIADINKHGELFGGGLLSKSLYFIAKNVSGALPAYKSALLYDERLTPRAVLIGVNPSKTEPEQYWQNINNICSKNGIRCIACGEVDMPDDEYRSNEFIYTDGDEVRFEVCIARAFETGVLKSDKKTAVLIGCDTSETKLRSLCEKLRHITLFGVNREYMSALADGLYAFNATAVLCAKTAADIRGCEATVVLNESCAERLRNFIGQNTVHIRETELTQTLLYTQTLGTFTVNSSYIEACAAVGIKI